MNRSRTRRKHFIKFSNLPQRLHKKHSLKLCINLIQLLLLYTLCLFYVLCSNVVYPQHFDFYEISRQNINNSCN